MLIMRTLKQSTINYITGGISLFLALALITSVISLYFAFENQKIAMERKIEFKQLGLDLANSSDYLTNQARRYVQFGDKKYFDNYWHEVNTTKTGDRVIARLKEMQAPQNELNLIEQAKSKSDTLIATEEAAMQAVEDNDFDLARHLMFDQPYEDAVASIMEPINQFQKTMNDRAERELEEANQSTQSIIVLILFLVALTLTSILVNLWITTSKIINPLQKLRDYMLTIAECDLTADIAVLTDESEIGQLGDAIIKTRDNLLEVVLQIRAGAEQLALSTQEVSSSTGEFAKAAESIGTSINGVVKDTQKQAGSIKESSMTIENMSANIELVAEKSGNLIEISSLTSSSTKDGHHAIGSAVQQMSNIESTMQKLSSIVARLEISSQEIYNIIATISGIAEQTNLLALNAAIEAARAGDQGKGFAVVAEEVRKLAEQVQIASKQISEMILDTQNDTNQAVMAMKAGDQEVRVGTEVVNAAGKTFETIADLVHQMVSRSSEITDIIKELDQGNENIIKAVDNMENVSLSTVEKSEDVSALTLDQTTSIQEIVKETQSRLH